MPGQPSFKQRFAFHIKSAIQNLADRCGYEIVPKPLARHLARRGATVVLDVGASVGGFGALLRSKGYQGKIVSFEPLPDAYQHLQKRASSDSQWQTLNLALGNEAGEADFHVTSNGDSSSLLPMLDTTTEAVPSIFPQEKIKVPVRRLDDVFDQYCTPADKVFLKMDVQGFEQQVLEGAEHVLPRIDGLLMELSLTRLYEGAPLFEELIAYVRARGFEPVWLFHGFKDSTTQQLLQMDGLFFRIKKKSPEMHPAPLPAP